MPKNSLLEGIRVLEVSHAVAGPTASQILADYGAEVIKIERPGVGDIFRNTTGMGSSMFLAVNRGKKSVALDLKKAKGKRILFDLVKTCDVIVENLGPGTAEKLGLTYRRIKVLNPRAIYCKIESFGKGSFQNVPAFDPVLQAATGIMSTTGFPPNQYVRAGVSIVDMSAAFHAATGVLALLNERTKTGKGGEVRVSLFDAAAYYMSYWLARYDLYKKDTSPLGTKHLFGAPYNLFKTKDGYIYIATANDQAWVSFCKSISFEDLLLDKKYGDNQSRVLRREKLESVISKRLRRLSTSHIVNSLKNSGVPFGKLNTAKSLLEDRNLHGSGIIREYSYSGKKFRTVVNPPIINGTRRFTKKAPSTLGEDTVSVLRSLLQLSTKEIAALKRNKVVAV